MLLLIDSGACLSVCLCNWRSWLPMRVAADASRDELFAGSDGYEQAALLLRRPDGAVCHVGGRSAELGRLRHGRGPADLGRGRLTAEKIVPDFGEHLRCSMYCGARLILVRRGRLHYLPVQVHRAEQKKINMVDAVMEPSKIKLYEYCCADDSLLAQCFLNHKQEALRLMLPDYDVSFKRNGRLVAEALRERARRHQQSLAWVALTCTPWCAWQNYNLRVCDGATVEKIKKARVESEEMINILYDTTW